MSQITGYGFAYDTERGRLRVLARITADVEVTVPIDTVTGSDELRDALAEAADTDDARTDVVHEWLTDGDRLDDVITVGAGRTTIRQVRLDDAAGYTIELDNTRLLD